MRAFLKHFTKNLFLLLKLKTSFQVYNLCATSMVEKTEDNLVQIFSYQSGWVIVLLCILVPILVSVLNLLMFIYIFVLKTRKVSSKHEKP